MSLGQLCALLGICALPALVWLLKVGQIPRHPRLYDGLFEELVQMPEALQSGERAQRAVDQLKVWLVGIFTANMLVRFAYSTVYDKNEDLFWLTFSLGGAAVAMWLHLKAKREPRVDV